MLEIKSAKVTTIPGASGWVQTYENSPNDPEKLQSKGKLFVIISTNGIGVEIDKISFGRDFMGKLSNEYFDSEAVKPFDALKNAVSKVIDEFKESLGSIEIACSAFAEGVVYSVASGGSKIVISRGGAVATILASQDVDVIAASGYPKANDKILLGTKSFFEIVPFEIMKSGLEDERPEATVETFTPLVHAEGGGTSGALIMKFEDRSIVTEAPKAEDIESSVVTEVSKPIAPNTPIVTNISSNISNFFKSITNKLPQRGIYIKSHMGDEAISQSRKLTFSIGIILLVILVVSIGFGVRQKKVNDLKKEYQSILAEATQEVEKAISLASVSTEESRELFISSEQKYQQIVKLNVKDPEVEELQKKIADSRAAILGEYSVNLELFLDLGLLSSGFSGDTITASGGQIFILDIAGSRIVSVTVDTKKSKVVAGPSVVENPQGIASYQDNVFVLLSDGIYELGLNKTKVIEKTWGGNAFIYAFAGNLYALDISGNAIYRYAGDGTTFGSQQNWLSTATKADFSEAKAWGMNGAVYVLYPNARILKYSLGSPQNFRITGASPEIGSIDAINADPDNNYVYLLDKAGKRVVVIDKDGKYKAQYINDQISSATSLVVSEEQKKIILLTGEKLYSIEIKHI